MAQEHERNMTLKISLYFVVAGWGRGQNLQRVTNMGRFYVYKTE